MTGSNTRGRGRGAAAAIILFCAAAAAKAQPAAEPPEVHAAAAPLGGPGTLDGIWINANFTDVRKAVPGGIPNFRTADGEPVPMLPGVAKVVADRVAAYYEDDATLRCVTPGMPFATSSPAQSPLQIVETPTQKQVTFLYEQFTTFRIINMDREHQTHPKPSAMGDAVGHWEGDTLVIDTIAVSDKTSILQWIPHSDQLHIVERIRRTGPNTMENRVMIDDPKTFFRPWTIVAHLKQVPGMRIAEFMCDNNRFGSE